MRLGSKILCSAAIPVVLVVGAAGSGMVALRDAGQEGQRALSRVAPVVREVAAAEESLATLGRLHSHWMAIGGAAYEEVWTSRMDGLEHRLLALRSSLETTAERRRLAKARAAVARYRNLVTGGTASFRPLTIADRRSLVAASDRARRSMDAIGHEIERTAWQTEQRAGLIARQAPKRMVAGAVLAALAALVMTSLVSRRLVRGLTQLTDASVALERGRLDQPIPVRGRDELARLAGALEMLAADLAERDRVNEDVIHRIGHDLTQPLVTIREAARTLAIELAASPAAREQSRALLIVEAATDLLQRVDHIGDDALRPPAALPAPETPRVALLESPVRRLPGSASLDEDRA